DHGADVSGSPWLGDRAAACGSPAHTRRRGRAHRADGQAVVERHAGAACTARGDREKTPVTKTLRRGTAITTTFAAWKLTRDNLPRADGEDESNENHLGDAERRCSFRACGRRADQTSRRDARAGVGKREPCPQHLWLT